MCPSSAEVGLWVSFGEVARIVPQGILEWDLFKWGIVELLVAVKSV